jgi:hypothetical protein
LDFVVVTFRQQNTNAEESAETESDLRRLDEVVVACHQNLSYRSISTPASTT